MFNSKNWRFGTSLLLTLGMTLGTATPGLMSKRAMAQFYGQGQTYYSCTLVPLFWNGNGKLRVHDTRCNHDISR